MTFGPEDSRRVGDYRGWAPAGRKREYDIEKWGHDHELWRMDLTGLDLGLVEDQIERAVRKAYTRHLLTDVGSARLILVLPSTLPHPLLSTVITSLFSRWKYPSITLLPSPTMAAVGAGVRSALVVDIGWSETSVTAVYEYREIRSKRSVRSMLFLLQELGKALHRHRQGEHGDTLRPDFELAEELMARMVWCRPANTEALDSKDDQDLEVDWPTDSSSKLVKLPSMLFSEPVEQAFLTPETPSQYLDDHERSLPLLVYECLQALPSDARAVCMSRIVFVGGGSHIPGLAPRILFEVDALVSRHGWSAVRGRKAADRRQRLGDIGQGRTEQPTARYTEPVPPGHDFAEEKVQKQQAKEALSFAQGQLRQVESLGAWAGASLLTSMKIKGCVEIERERFLQHGLAGAHRDGHVGVVPPRAGPGIGLSRSSSDRTSWTLAGWG